LFLGVPEIYLEIAVFHQRKPDLVHGLSPV
jgi:hypothetical protein